MKDEVQLFHGNAPIQGKLTRELNALQLAKADRRDSAGSIEFSVRAGCIDM
jgi:hypothetical protein